MHMAAGVAEGSTFDIEIRVADIDDFYGAAFHVSFDPESVEFARYDSAGSILLGQGSGTSFHASPIVPGEPAVAASLLGQTAGIPDANGLLLTLCFNVTAGGASSVFTFGPEASRKVTICPTAGQACDYVADVLIWTGGALVAP